MIKARETHDRYAAMCLSPSQNEKKPGGRQAAGRIEQ
jgi:hypothetical protein